MSCSSSRDMLKLASSESVSESVVSSLNKILYMRKKVGTGMVKRS